MKKTKTVTIAAVPEHTKDFEIVVCDICGIESNTTVGTGLSQTMGLCYLCGCHVCRRLSKSCAKSDPEEWGDYPAIYCPICYELRFNKYKKERDLLREEFDQKMEALENKMREESISHKQKTE